jgi:hypothetical protein
MREFLPPCLTSICASFSTHDRLIWMAMYVHTSVLLASTRDTPYGREIEAALFHAGENEVERLNPHGHGRVDLVFFLDLVHSTGDAIVGQVFVENDGLFMYGFQVRGNGQT